MNSSSTDLPAAAGRVADVGSPRLSAVVVSFATEPLLVQCLEALTVQARRSDVEMVVVRDREHPENRSMARLKARFTGVRWVDAPPCCTVPRMRAIGIHESRGEIIALLEDDCVVEPGWCDAVIAAHRTPDFAIAGAVEPGPYRRALDWGVYFCDYGRFMLPLPAGPAVALPGNNTSYKRAALARLPAGSAQEFYEVFVHWAWQKTGAPMRADEAVRVRNVHSWTLADVTRIPYHHGRAFAGQRFAGQPRWRRIVIGLLALFLPALKVGRIIRDTLSRKRRLGRLILALPWVVVLTASWSIGESVGSLCGPGESVSVWR